MESRVSPPNNLVIRMIAFFQQKKIYILDGGEHVRARSAQCFISLSLVSEEIASQMRLIHFLHAASGQRSRGGLPERRPQYFHVLICPPRVRRYKSLSSSSARGRAREAVRGKALYYIQSVGENRTLPPRTSPTKVLRQKRSNAQQLMTTHQIG